MICQYCNQPAKLIKGSELYDKIHTRLQEFNFWHCTPCKAWVGCHRGTVKPFGELANRELRRARMRAHEVFDPLWKEGTGLTRDEAYNWLAGQLSIQPSDCHIGMFNLEQCRKVQEVCREK